MHKKKRGWNPFWASLGAALLVLVPLVGGTVLLSRQQLRTQLRQAAQSEQGIPVRLPKEEDRLTVLLCTAGEQSGFVLLYLNADQNVIRLLAIPAELSVPFGQGEATLAQCYAAAGPARCLQALTEPLALPEDARYLALSAAVLEQLAGRYGTVRVGFSGALTAEELAQYDRTPAVQGISAAEAHDFLCRMDAEEKVPVQHRAAARAAVWDAFFRQNLDLLPTTLPDGLRSNSSVLLTDLTALDYSGLERTLEFLANGEASVWSQGLPLEWDALAGRYTVTEASRAAVKTCFSVSPTEAQAASEREP